MKDKFHTSGIERPLGLAVIGASKFAEFCLEQYRTLPQLRPVAVWSRTPAHAAEFAHKHQLRAAESLPALLADDQLSRQAADLSTEFQKITVPSLKRDMADIVANSSESAEATTVSG